MIVASRGGGRWHLGFESSRRTILCIARSSGRPSRQEPRALWAAEALKEVRSRP